MPTSVFDSPLHSGLFGDEEVAAILDDQVLIRNMVAVETALAEAQADCELIPRSISDEIAKSLKDRQVSTDILSQGMAADGVAVPALVRELRSALSDEAAHWLHWGATSQDIVDTAIVLQLRDVLSLLEVRLEMLIRLLHAESLKHVDLVIAARTRSQVSTPTTFGLRIARWVQPLISSHNDLAGLRDNVLRVQLGGASGANTAVGSHGRCVTDALADRLGLAPGPSWHTDRTSIAELVGWLGRLTAALSKMARDLILMGRTEAREVLSGSGGRSSTMPQKANPVQAETIVALATYVAAQQTAATVSAVHAEERDGPLWSLEWIVLPGVLAASGAAMRHSLSLAASLTPNAERIRTTLSLDHGAVMSEAASFALARHMSRAEAQALIKKALTLTSAKDISLSQALDSLSDAPIDWAAVLDPDTAVDSCREMMQRIYAASPLTS